MSRDIHVTPTLTVFEAYGVGAGAVANLKRFAQAGVKIALGNDYTDVPQNKFPHFDPACRCSRFEGWKQRA